MIRGLRFLILSSVLLLASLADAAEFVVTAPKVWTKVPAQFAGEIYRKSTSRDDIIVMTSFRANSPEIKTVVREAQEIAKQRRIEMAVFGLRDYEVLGSEAGRIVGSSVIKGIYNLESRYIDLQGKDVRAFERYYYTSDRIYQITYVTPSRPTFNREQIRTLLDQFKPKVNGRMPATSGELVGGVTQPGPTQPGEAKVLPKHPLQPMDCSFVPEERRRTDFNPMSAKSFIMTGLGCGSLAWDLLMLIRDIDNFVHPETVRKMIVDDNYRAQVSAVTAAAVEAIKSPTETAVAIASAGIEWMSQKYKEFPCTDDYHQSRTVCEFIAGVTGAKASLSLVKLAKKIALSKQEAQALGSIAEDALKKGASGATGLTDRMTEVTDKVKKRLGYLPKVEDGLNDQYSRMIELFDRNGEPMGSLPIRNTGTVTDVVKIGYLEINEPYRNKGLAEYLFATMFKNHPSIKIIQSTMEDSNLKVAKELLAAGKSCEEALMGTPSGKIRQKWGFTKIIKADCTSNKNSFIFDVSR